jgi:4-amino-4-deoxy-L-arabinose transferase-like glycosyltransferase
MVMPLDAALDGQRSTWLVLLAILALALIVRIAGVAFFVGAIDSEGAEYGRIAENILAGKGYQGIAGEGTQLFFPPLYPLLLVVASLITGDIKTGGHWIAVIAGTLMALPVYGIAARMYGRRIALIAMTLVAFQPFLIYLATTVSVEATFLAVIFAAIYFTFAAVDDPRPRNSIASGVLYGLAYLLRPEATAYMAVAIAILVLNVVMRQRHAWPAQLARIGLLIVPFLCLAAPYALWLSTHAGEIRIEGKTPLNIATELRILDGEPYHSANFAVATDGTEQGVWNQPNIVTIKAHSQTSGEFAAYLATKAKTVWRNTLSRLVTGPYFGSPLMFALVILGLFARPWYPALALHQLHLMGLVGLVVLGTFFIYYDHPRFYVVALLIFCVWAAAGLERLVRWGRVTGRALGWRDLYRRALGALIGVAALGALLAGPALASKWLFETSRAERAVKTAGEWLRDNSTKPIRLLYSSTPLAFHAGAEHFWLPYCDEATALRYIDRRDITHVAVRTGDRGAAPYVVKWVTGGLPLANARMVHSFDLGAGETVKIYAIGR